MNTLVQLNSPERPPVEEYAMAVRRERLMALARLFNPPAEVIPGGRLPARSMHAVRIT
jgi:hypothetical protein